MLEIERRRGGFKIKEIWFADHPFDVSECDGVSFHACKRRIDAKGFTCREEATLLVDLSQDLDAVWANMRRDHRRGINSAKERGVRILRNQGHEKFHQLYQSLVRRKRIPPGSWGRLDFIKRYGTLFVAEFDGQILTGCLYVEDEDHIRSILSASVERTRGGERRLAGNAVRLLKWETIDYAKSKGIKGFDLGGVYVGEARNEETDGVTSFKTGFGGKLTMLYEYRKDYSRLLRFARKLYGR